VLFNDEETLGRLDDLLELGALVAWMDDEASRVAADLLVDAQRDGDPFAARVVGALTDELRDLLARARRMELLDPFVHLAKQRLVTARPFLPKRHTL